MKMNTDRDWLLKMAELEDGYDITVGPPKELITHEQHTTTDESPTCQKCQSLNLRYLGSDPTEGALYECRVCGAFLNYFNSLHT